MAFPIRDTQLVAYSTNWNDRLTADPLPYGLTAADATAYNAVHVPYIAAVSALQVAREAGIRSKPLLETRDAARDALLTLGRELYAFVQADTSVTDAAKAELGVVVRDREPTPSPVPIRQPHIGVADIMGHVLVLTVHGSASEKRRPAGTFGAKLYYATGETAPATLDGWKDLAIVGKPLVTVTVPSEVAAGSKLWLTGCWFNYAKETGPLSEPISTYIGGGVSQAA